MPQPPTYLPPDITTATAMLGSSSRARLLHVLLHQEHPLLTSALAREAGLQYRTTLTHLQKLEEAGAVTASIAHTEPRQGKDVRWSLNRPWLTHALHQLTSYLTIR